MILTGRNFWQLGAAGNHEAYWPEKFKSYVEVLNDHGYFAGRTGKGWAPGVARLNGKRRHLTGRPFNEHQTTPPTRAMSSNDYAANFRAFLDEKPAGEPFVFWYGSKEPHPPYDYGAALREGGKALGDIDQVPPFWPESDTVRTTLLDYAFEIEHFDRHLGRMLRILEECGELKNTLVVVTSDNGMAAPRLKGQEYELGVHMPLTIMWPEGIQNPGRAIEDHVSFIDVAPTFLEVAGVSEEQSAMQPITGRSLTDIFSSGKAGQVNPERDRVLIGKERHDMGRPGDVGYPIRGIVTDAYFYLRNFRPDRWPAGNPATGYLNTSGSPMKTHILNARKDPKTLKYWAWSFGKRPAEELYRLPSDPANVNNLAGETVYQPIKGTLREQLFAELKAQGDPRMFGRGDVFDEYRYSSPTYRNFYEKYMSGALEKTDPGWVNPSDFASNFPDSLRVSGDSLRALIGRE